MSYHKESADEFLDKANLVSQQVSDILSGKIDVHELDRMEKEKKFIDEQLAILKARKKEQMLKKGRKGKGHQGGYERYCQRCQIEFDFAFENCTHCEAETQTNEQRLETLHGMGEAYKLRKAKKLTRRAKWENWRKTQEMFYKKTGTNYHKWDVFESDESTEEEQEPIVPKNDPTFQAMEADINERSRKRKKDKKAATILKDKGNDMMKRGLYKTANHNYTQALECAKDYMVIYTNRALARIKLQMWQEGADDCTRVLEYQEVFNDNYLKEPDLCFKALTRRAQAMRGMKEFDLCLADLVEAEKLYPDQEAVRKLRKTYEDDWEHEKRVGRICADADNLKGKEFIDFLLNFLQGKMIEQKEEEEEPKKRGPKLPKYCKLELNDENATKLRAVLKEQGEDVTLYMNTRDGMKVLCDSLEFNDNGIDILSDVLPLYQKLREDFQRQRLYERLIDFLYKRNLDAEGNTLADEKVLKILTLLENASMHEEVRSDLSEKKKIKDLFLVVINSIDIKNNRVLVSQLISFASNLCYGTGKFRRMLIADKDRKPEDFFATLRQILMSVAEPESKKDSELLDENKSPNKEPKAKQEDGKKVDLKQAESDRVLLKQCLLNLISNLLIEPQLRVMVSADMSGLLSSVVALFKRDNADRRFDYAQSCIREYNVLINAAQEKSGQELLTNMGLINDCKEVFNNMIPDQSMKDVFARTIHLLSKLARNPTAAEQMAQSKDLLPQVLLFFATKEDEIFRQNVIIWHAVCRTPNFFQVYTEQHKLPEDIFEAYLARILKEFEKSHAAEDNALLINCCASITAFTGAFPAHLIKFKSLIPSLVFITANKTELLRKNAAVLMARLSNNEENLEEIRANHGTDVLLSLKDVLT